MKTLLLLGVLTASMGGATARTISTAGTTLTVPGGWHAAVSLTPQCDPERLIAVSSAPLRIRAGGRVAPEPAGNVLLLLLEDRYLQDRPVGDLRRPAHFAVAWSRLRRLKAVCGNPDAPAFMRHFKSRGRYLGFIVYPSGRVPPQVRRATLELMDSLRVRHQGRH
jgi:hypothetical protein